MGNYNNLAEIRPSIFIHFVTGDKNSVKTIVRITEPFSFHEDLLLLIIEDTIRGKYSFFIVNENYDVLRPISLEIFYKAKSTIQGLLRITPNVFPQLQ